MYNEANFTIPFIGGGMIVQFDFKNLVLGKYDLLKQELVLNEKSEEKRYPRIGRVLAPYSNKIQQRYAEFLNRIPLNSIPDIFFKTEE